MVWNYVFCGLGLRFIGRIKLTGWPNFELLQFKCVLVPKHFIG